MTDTSPSSPPLEPAPSPPSEGPTAAAPTRTATASLVLGIVALVCNPVLVPTILAIVFGAVALSRGTARRTRAIVGVVLGALGIIAFGVQAAIAIPVLLGLQHAAVASSVESSLTDRLTGQGLAVSRVDCPTVRRPAAGMTEICTVMTSTGADVRVGVTFTDARGAFTYRIIAVG